MSNRLRRQGARRFLGWVCITAVLAAGITAGRLAMKREPDVLEEIDRAFERAARGTTMGVPEIPKLFPVIRDGKWGYMDREGQVVIPVRFDGACRFSDGLAAVNVGGIITGKWGYIDETGEVIIEPQFDRVLWFSEGLAPVRVAEAEGKWGYIDREGKAAIEPRFEKAYPFQNGRAVAWAGGEAGYINRTGSPVPRPAGMPDVSTFKGKRKQLHMAETMSTEERNRALQAHQEDDTFGILTSLAAAESAEGLTKQIGNLEGVIDVTGGDYHGGIVIHVWVLDNAALEGLRDSIPGTFEGFTVMRHAPFWSLGELRPEFRRQIEEYDHPVVYGSPESDRRDKLYEHVREEENKAWQGMSVARKKEFIDRILKKRRKYWPDVGRCYVMWKDGWQEDGQAPD